jgi:hypothetical protein
VESGLHLLALRTRTVIGELSGQSFRGPSLRAQMKRPPGNRATFFFKGE